MVSERRGGLLPVEPEYGSGTPPHRCHRQRFAVCIGINLYQNGSGFGRLSHASNDAVELAHVLAETCGFERVLLMCDDQDQNALNQRFARWIGGGVVEIIPDVSWQSIVSQTNRFLAGATAEDDMVLFFFFGAWRDSGQDSAVLGSRGL